jgi:hypothetical protein
VSDVKEIIDKITTLTKHGKRIAKLLDAYADIKEQPVDNAYLLEKRFGEIEKALDLLPASGLHDTLSTWLQSERAVVSKLKEDFRFQFGQQLKNMFEKNGIKVRGQYPLLRIGFFTLKLNFEFGEAILFFGPEVEKLKSKIPLQAQTIYNTAKQYEQSMKGESFDETKVFQDLYAAYRRCVKNSGSSTGEKVRISEVLREYVFLKQPKLFISDPSREHYREYPRIRVSYMLYRLKVADIGASRIRFHVATFDATVDKAKSLWIPDNEEGDGTHCEYLSIESPQE